MFLRNLRSFDRSLEFLLIQGVSCCFLREEFADKSQRLKLQRELMTREALMNPELLITWSFRYGSHIFPFRDFSTGIIKAPQSARLSLS